MILLDASSLYVLVREADEQALLKILENSRVTALTDYEIGNILYKTQALAQPLSEKELYELASKTKHLLKSLTHVSTHPESFEETLRLAVQEQVSYYDASYIQSAKQLNLTLATEDRKLAKKAAKYIKATNTTQLLKKA